MTATETLIQLIAENERVAAPIVSLSVSWLLYGVLGKRFLGADDDFWPAIRGWLLPKLDAIGATGGLYAQAKHTSEEYIGHVDMDLDEFEERLEAAGFYRNPLASYKTSPQDWQSNGSWARRYGSLRGLGESIRTHADALKADPFRTLTLPGWFMSMLGRFVQCLGDVLAARQLHVTVFEPVEGQLYLYGHDEPNSLNPLTAWRHFRAKSWNPERGVRKMQEELADMDVEYDRSKPP